VRCTDGPFGELADVVIDPVHRRVTHLVVAPRHRHRLARLVPVELAAAGEDGAIQLRLGVADVRRLEPVQEFAYLRLDEHPVDDPEWDVGIATVLAMPYFAGPGTDLGIYPLEDDIHVDVVYDRIPKGEVEIRRASAVRDATGAELGRVDGLLVGPDDQVTHVVMAHGHPWGRREIAIPIGSVCRVETDVVTLDLTAEEVAGLPEVDVHRPR
jgi:hypothetical protein